ncbi:MAG: hypothetical protein HONDAALG_04094 [Gammaproteobacteria bacterium]|nr:hypothetical protein [Gammaproteobacteria bacterium]
MSRLVIMDKLKNIVLLFETVLLVFLLINKSSSSTNKNSAPVNIPTEKTAQKSTGDELEFPPLNLPVEYFDKSALNIGAGAYSTLHDNDQFYRSYPSEKISLSNSNYSVTPKDLPLIKTDKQIHTENPEADFMGEAKQQSIKKYGDLARRYVGDPAEGWLVDDVVYSDLDQDGVKEQIVSLSKMGANVIGGKTIVIKNNKEIFSTSETTFSTLKPAEYGNGFYLVWDDNFKQRDGYVITRFIVENNTFKPVYEQKVRYIRVVEPKN